MSQEGERDLCRLEAINEELKKRLEISICVYGNQFSRETVYKWFTVFRFFKPTRMAMVENGVYHPKRYSAAALKDAALDNKISSLFLGDTNWGNMEMESDGLSAHFRFNIPLVLWEEQKSEMKNKIEELFVELGGCFGFVVNCFDDQIIQNPGDAEVYKRHKVDDSDFPGVNDIPIIRLDWPTPYPIYRMDPTYLPGHKEWYGKLTFTIAPYMWFGPDFNRFFSQEKIEKYNNCEENTEIAAGYRRICLWSDVAEYNASLYRDRQWSFRNEIEMDKTIKELKGKPFIPKENNYTPDPSVELKRGNFPHGGTLLAKFYIDNKGRACSKSVAYACVQREMDGNTIVWQERIKVQ